MNELTLAHAAQAMEGHDLAASSRTMEGSLHLVHDVWTVDEELVFNEDATEWVFNGVVPQ